MSEYLREQARRIRELILISLTEAGSGHLGGSLDLADIFSVLYFEHLRHDPHNPDWEDRDKLILSIGHTAPVLYATLALAGYYPIEELHSLRQLGSRLQGHPSKAFQLPGLESCSGSLGQGLGVAMGMALAARMDKRPTRVYCVLGDGELQEGSVWETAMAAAHHRLDNLCAIVDRNRLQIDGRTEDVLALDPLDAKWSSFGWQVLEIDGHDIGQIKEALECAATIKDKPSVVIANTIMGKGVPSIENDCRWHGKVPTSEQLASFLKELYG